MKAKFDKAGRRARRLSASMTALQRVWPFRSRLFLGSIRTRQHTPITPGATRIAEPAAPPMKNNSWTLTAKVKTEGEKTEGVIMGFGGVAAGITLYLEKGVPVFCYNYFGDEKVLKGKKALDSGDATLEVDFDYEGKDKQTGGPATISLKINGEQVDQQKMKSTVPGRFGIDTFGIGEDSGQPVTEAYQPPFPFTGTIEKVTIEMK